jgi:hypothetical protein
VDGLPLGVFLPAQLNNFRHAEHDAVSAEKDG